MNLWIEVAVVATIFAVGNITIGHWEVHTPKWRRLLKFVLFVALVVALSNWLGRVWSFGFLGLMGVAALIVHGWWLPKQGINGWTGEPKEKYYEMRGWKYPPVP